MSDVIAKITKLLALAAAAGTPEEAANAATRAQEIMLRHKIERADLEAAGAAPVEAIDSAILLCVKYRDPWMGTVALGVARAFDCEVYWWTDGEGKTLRLVGRTFDLKAAAAVFAYLKTEIERQADADYERGRFTPLGAASGSWKWKNSFRLGAASTVHTRLFAYKRDQEAGLRKAANQLATSSLPALSGDVAESKAMTVTGTTALALIHKDQADVKAKMADLTGGRLRKGRASSSHIDGRAFDNGTAAGNRMDLGLSSARPALR